MRGAAYRTLAAFDFALLRQLEAGPAAGAYSGFLRAEADAGALAELQPLVARALEDEHARRRQLAHRRSGPHAALHQSSVLRATRQLPKRVCDHWAAHAGNFAEVRVAAPAVLACFRAPRPAPAASGAGGAAAEFRRVYAGVARVFEVGGTFGLEGGGEFPLLLPLVDGFVRRWGAAEARGREAAEAATEEPAAFTVVLAQLDAAAPASPAGAEFAALCTASLYRQWGRGSARVADRALAHARVLLAALGPSPGLPGPAGAFAARAVALATLHPLLPADLQDALVDALARRVRAAAAAPGAGAVIRAGAAALGAIVDRSVFAEDEDFDVATASDAAAGRDRRLGRALTAVLAALAAACPAELTAPARALLAAAPPAWGAPAADVEAAARDGRDREAGGLGLAAGEAEEAVAGGLACLARLAAAAAYAGPAAGGAFVAACLELAEGALALARADDDPAAMGPGRRAYVRGGLAVLPVVLEAGLRAGACTAGRYRAAAATARAVAAAPDVAPAVAAAAAEAWGSLVHVGTCNGVPFPLADVAAGAEALLAEDPAGPSVRSRGCLVGLANLLGAQASGVRSRASRHFGPLLGEFSGSAALRAGGGGGPRAEGEEAGAGEAEPLVHLPLLLEEDAAPLAKACFQRLEQVAFSKAAGQAARKAAFAAIAGLKLFVQRWHAAGGPGGPGGRAGAPRGEAAAPAEGALGALPEEGMTRTLVQQLAAMEEPEPDAAAAAAALARARAAVLGLASLRRFPAANWPGLCRKAFRMNGPGPGGGPAGAGVQEAVVELLYACCDASRFKSDGARLGLSLKMLDLLEELLVPQLFVDLGPGVQHALLAGLGGVATFCPQRLVRQILQALPAVLDLAVARRLPHGRAVFVDAWAALRAFFELCAAPTPTSGGGGAGGGAAEPAHALLPAAQAAAGALYARLPVHGATPGEEGGDENGLEAGLTQLATADLWDAAAGCLALAPRRWLLAELLAARGAGPAGLRAALMRCHLARQGHLGLEALVPSTALLLAGDGAGAGALPAAGRARLLPVLAAAVRHCFGRAPAGSVPVKWLLETVEVTLESPRPERGVGLLTAAAASLVLADDAPALHAAALLEGDAVLAPLAPHVWTLLVRDPRFHPHRAFVANKLLELAAQVHGPSRLALACALRGCREALPRSSVARAMALGDAEVGTMRR